MGAPVNVLVVIVSPLIKDLGILRVKNSFPIV